MHTWMKSTFWEKFFVWSLSWLSSVWNFVGIVCDSSLLLPRMWQNCFWTSYNKLCQVSSSSIHTLKLYQRAILRSKSYTKQTTTRTTTVSDICFYAPDKNQKYSKPPFSLRRCLNLYEPVFIYWRFVTVVFW